jgi:hypothetical protein
MLKGIVCSEAAMSFKEDSKPIVVWAFSDLKGAIVDV